MPKGLHTLMRIKEWEVDQRRRDLGNLLGTLAALEGNLRGIEEELIREQGLAQASPEEAGLFYGDYANAVIERRHHLDDSIAQIEVQIAAAREDLNAAYRELKKCEVVQQNRDTRETRELARREQETLDELGLEVHRRKNLAARLGGRQS